MKKPSLALLPAFLLASVGGSSPRAFAVERAPARADDSGTSTTTDATLAQARAAAVEGYRLLDAGRPVDALAKFEEAHGLRGGDKLRFNLGQALAAIPGREADAYQEFSLYLQRVLDAPPASVSVAKKAMTTLRAKIALVSFSVSPEGADLVLDGQRVHLQQPAQPVPLLPGRHFVRVEQSGFVALEKTLNLLPGQQTEHSMTLVASAPASAPTQPVHTSTPSPAPGPALGQVVGGEATRTGPSGAPPPVSAVASVTVGPTPVQTSRSEAPAPAAGTSPLRTAAYVVGGVGVAALAVGSVFGLRAFSKKSEAKANCSPGTFDQDCKDPAASQASTDDGRRSATVSNVAFGVGVAAVVAGVVLWVRSRPSEISSSVPPSAAHSFSFSPTVSYGGAGLSFAW